MTPIGLTSGGLSDTKPAPLDRAKQLAATLLSERSEASGALVARQLHEVLRALDAGDRGILRHHGQLSLRPCSIENNREAFVRDRTIVRSAEVDALMQASLPLPAGERSKPERSAGFG